MFKSINYFFMCVFIVKNILALNNEQKINIQKIITDLCEECIVEHPLSTDDIDSFRNHTFPDSEDAGCFLACVFNKSGILDNKEEFSAATVIEKAKTIFDDEEELKNLEDFTSVCAIKVNDENVNDNKCDRAKLIYTCLTENSEQFGFNIDF